MGYNWVTSVYNLAVITSLIEHTHIYTEDTSHVYGTVCTTFIRADNHEMIVVNL